MPACTIQTSATLPAGGPDDFLSACTNLVSEELGKPASVVMVSLQQSAMQMGGSSDPCALVTLASLGGLGPEMNKRLSESLCDLLELHLKCVPERIFIHFEDRDRSDWGWNRNTFA